MDYKQILKELKSNANPKNAEGMARFGIKGKEVYGISIPTLRRMAKEIGKNHKLALKLWESGIHEARILASMIDDPDRVTEEQMEAWVVDFDSWDLCDQVCGNLFDKTSFAFDKAVEWSSRSEEFVKRAGFALMAWYAVHNKEADDKVFAKLLPVIKRESIDERNFVKKAVNWALRQIGKRNKRLNIKAIATAHEIKKMSKKARLPTKASAAASWVAADALRELTSDKVQERLRR